jgi:hypothetical protein
MIDVELYVIFTIIDFRQNVNFALFLRWKIGSENMSIMALFFYSCVVIMTIHTLSTVVHG